MPTPSINEPASIATPGQTIQEINIRSSKNLTIGLVVLTLVFFGTSIHLFFRDPPRALQPIIFPDTISRSDVIKAERHMSKVYAVCPSVGSAKYVMAWTARALYTYDLKATDIAIKRKSPTTETGTSEPKKAEEQFPEVTLEVTIPEIKLEGGRAVIADTDHYKFSNDYLLASWPGSMDKHYKEERARAQEIANYYALDAIVNDKKLLDLIREGIKADVFELAGQIKTVDRVTRVDVIIPPSTLKPVAPTSPRLCREQPFNSQISLSLPQS